MTNRRDILIIAGLFVALIAFVVFGPEKPPEQMPDLPTTHSTSEHGVTALFSWAQAMGYDTQRLEYRDFSLSEEDHVLLILRPTEPVTPAHAQATMQWVAKGGTLILADDNSQLFGDTNALLKELLVESVPFTQTTIIEHATTLQPVFDSPPIHELEVQADRVLLPQRDDYTALIGSEQGVLLAGIRHGRGYVYLSSTVYPFTNIGLRNQQNAGLVLNLLRRIPAGGRIVFDEYHHGFIRTPTPAVSLTGTPIGWALLYAILAIGLYMILSGRRFGKAIPLAEETQPRTSLEFVESMADLFQRGEKRDFVLQHYYHDFKRRLARPLGINTDLDDQDFAREVALVQGLSAADQEQLHLLLIRMRQHAGDEGSLLRIVTDADSFLAHLERQ